MKSLPAGLAVALFAVAPSAADDFGHFDWDVGITAHWRQQWALDLRRYGANIARAGCYGMNWCEPAVVAKITYNFIVL